MIEPHVTCHALRVTFSVGRGQLTVDSSEGIGEIDWIGGLDDWHFAELSVQTPSAIMNSSGTSCRSIASLRSAFKHCFAVFKKEVQSPIEICKAGIEDRTK
jgi:hypothetical protein